MADVFHSVGGEAFFESLIARFYENVENDPILRPMYPKELDEARRHLALFFIQNFGGPKTYQAERGHPRLRMRHLEFPIDQTARDAWMACMTDAFAKSGINPELAKAMLADLGQTATFLINRGLALGNMR